jgi:fatty acid amide hydrolase 2
VQDDGRRPVCAELRQAQQKAADALAARGALVEVASFADFRHAFDMWSAMLALANPHSFRELLYVDRPQTRTRYAFLRWAARRSPHTFPSLTLAAAERITARFPDRTRRYADLGEALRAEVGEKLGDGVMLYPSHPTPAPRHHVPLARPFNFTYTAIMNILELPATQVPLGLDAKGLPLGVQVAAAHGGDHLTVATALALEEDFGGWVPPKL